jgi:ABC-2 type transport system ATP-binding protein
VRGAGVSSIIAPLKAAPGVLSVAAFGNAVHVAGLDGVAVLHALHSLGSLGHGDELHIVSESPNLEDVFISLMSSAQDNFDAAPAKRGQP